MLIEEIRLLIDEHLPDILQIGDFDHRVRKCIEIIKSTYPEYVNDYLADYLDMLDMSLLENEATEMLKENNRIEYVETKYVLDICRCCLYETRRWREIPLHLVSRISDYNFELFGIRVGTSIADSIESLNKYGVDFIDHRESQYIEIENKLVDAERTIRFSLYIYYKENRVSLMYFTESTSYIDFWKTMAAIDSWLKPCRYKFESCSEKGASLKYFTYYENISVCYGSGDVNVKIEKASKKNNKWWKL